ncbi:MAG: biotin/lipoyl-containing protein [Candidatus Limiplasma sp.]|nr:biotin/lipoyl-containing protein [Candidatus Limiplasma sp.]
MRQFNITVNGTPYQVSVEEVGAAYAAPAAAPVAAPAPKAAPAAAPAPVAAAPKAAPVVGGNKVSSPMPGTILDVRVSEGAAVKKGDVLMILEAMKMENEILCPADGTVKQVAVNKGASVNSGDVLVVIG